MRSAYAQENYKMSSAWIGPLFFYAIIAFSNSKLLHFLYFNFLLGSAVAQHLAGDPESAMNILDSYLKADVRESQITMKL